MAVSEHEARAQIRQEPLTAKPDPNADRDQGEEREDAQEAQRAAGEAVQRTFTQSIGADPVEMLYERAATLRLRARRFETLAKAIEHARTLKDPYGRPMTAFDRGGEGEDAVFWLLVSARDL